MTKRLIAVVLIGLAWGCNSPVTPRPQSEPSVPTPQTRLNVSGIVTDDDGAPVAGADVGLSSLLGAARRFRTMTRADGRYELDFPEELVPPAFISAHSLERTNFLPLEWGASKTAVKNIRLRRPANIFAGQSAVVSFEQDSSLCVWEFSASDSMSCETFTVTLEAPGLVTVEARPMDGATTPVLIGWENPGRSDRFSVRLDSTGGRLWLNLSIPRGLTPRYEVNTWFER